MHTATPITETPIAFQTTPCGVHSSLMSRGPGPTVAGSTNQPLPYPLIVAGTPSAFPLTVAVQPGFHDSPSTTQNGSLGSVTVSSALTRPRLATSVCGGSETLVGS